MELLDIEGVLFIFSKLARVSMFQSQYMKDLVGRDRDRSV
jgi:hypothetical protein